MLDSPAIHRHPRFYTQAVAAVGGGPAVPAGWNRTEVVGHFDTMWRVKFAAGEDGLRFHAPTAATIRPGPSTRADGMSAEGMTSEDLATLAHMVQCQIAYDPSTRELAFVTGFHSLTFARDLDLTRPSRRVGQRPLLSTSFS